MVVGCVNGGLLALAAASSGRGGQLIMFILGPALNIILAIIAAATAWRAGPSEVNRSARFQLFAGAGLALAAIPVDAVIIFSMGWWGC